jgi:hypothetical protein
MALDRTGRCCGYKPRSARTRGGVRCRRCKRGYDQVTLKQRPNFYWERAPDGSFAPRVHLTTRKPLNLCKHCGKPASEAERYAEPGSLYWVYEHKRCRAEAEQK